MPVSVVNIGNVWMRVGGALVMMGVRVRLAGRIIGTVPVLMMFVVNVEVLVSHCLVRVLVLMAFREVQPHTDGHETGGHPKDCARRFVQDEK